MITGYSIFAVVPYPDSGPMGLPPCTAAELALSLPEPRGASNGYPAHMTASTSSGSGGTHTYFNGNGHSLAGPSSAAHAGGFAPAGSAADASVSSPRKGKRPASLGAHDLDHDDDDDDVIIEDPATTSASGGRQRQRQRQRRRVGEGPSRGAGAEDEGAGAGSGAPTGAPHGEAANGMSEEEMMAAAIAASLKVSSGGTSDAGGGGGGRAGDSAGGSQVRSARAFCGGRSTCRSSVARRTVEVFVRMADPPLGPLQQATRSRAAQAEEDEFQRALQASLDETGGAQQSDASEEPEEEEDSPSLEELRRRRAARFG